MNKNDIIEKIIKLSTENNITKYEIANATGISEAGVGKILNRKTENPQLRTLEPILNYILNKIGNNSPKGIVEEPSVPYYVKPREIELLEEIIKKQDATIKSLQEQIELLKEVKGEAKRQTLSSTKTAGHES